MRLQTVQRTVFRLLLLSLAMCRGAYAAPVGPSPYLQAGDSPFQSLTFSYFHLENFEDGLLNTPGVSPAMNYLVISPGADTDSVDADDSVLDGSGVQGRSLYSSVNGQGVSEFRFEFSQAPLGDYPTHVGIVWTDVGRVIVGDALFVGDVSLEAFDPMGASLGVLGPIPVGGDGSTSGGTAEDRFLGFTDAGGISAFSVRMPNSIDWEVDHLQYGLIVPEPGSFALLSMSLIGFAALRRLRSRIG